MSLVTSANPRMPANQNLGTPGPLINSNATPHIQTQAAVLLSRQGLHSRMPASLNRVVQPLNSQGAKLPIQNKTAAAMPVQPQQANVSQQLSVPQQAAPIIIQIYPQVNQNQIPAQPQIIQQQQPTPISAPASTQTQTQQPLAQRVAPILAKTPAQNAQAAEQNVEEKKSNCTKIALIIIAVIAAVALIAIAAAFLMNIVLILPFIAVAAVCVTIGISCTIASVKRASANVLQDISHVRIPRSAPHVHAQTRALPMTVTVPRIKTAVDRGFHKIGSPSFHMHAHVAVGSGRHNRMRS